MTRLSKITALSLTGALVATLAVAQQDPIGAAVKARQAHMDLYAFNVGQLGAMAQGAVAYDAGLAQAAADNLVALTGVNQMAYWPVGSEAGVFEGSRAKAELWSSMDDVMAKSGAMAEAALAMQAAAGSLEGLQGAMGALGGSCGGCHEAYRVAN
jgi:cytochrome c556